MFSLTPTKAKRAITACRNCRQRKVKCSGGDPCKDCTRLSKDCIYPPHQRRKRKPKHLHNELPPVRSENGGQGSRVSEIGDNLHGISLLGDNTASRAPSPSFSSMEVEDGDEERHSSTQHTRDSDLLRQHSRSLRPDTEVHGSRLPPHRPREAIVGNNVNISDDLAVCDDNDEMIPITPWQYHEVWSWTSICSDVGTKWVCDITGSQDFAGIAGRFERDLCRRLPSDNFMSTSMRLSEINEPTAWEYVDAFYQNCWEADIGIIERTEFTSRLQSHFRKQEPDSQPAWLALRNVVYAGGYRSLLAKSPTLSFSSAQKKAGVYFKNALSVFLKIVLPPSSLTAIQALTLMACYVEGLGDLALKHFLCSSAVHLAYTLGLHRQPEKSWDIAEDETLKRNWLWWTLYALEKQLSFCSGRPSAIDDENISVRIPTTIPTGSNIHLQNLSIAVRIAKTCSQISRQISSLKAIHMSVHELIDTMTRFDNELKQLLEEIPTEFKIGMLARPPHSTPRLIHTLYLHFSIYGGLMAVHAHLFYPWLSSRLTKEGSNAALESQIALSTCTVAEAARRIILAVRLITTTVASPSWLAFFYPLYAHINLFIYVLRYPTLSTTRADLGLLDVCAGHFGYIEFLTSSQISVSLPREVANFVSKVVKVAKSKEAEPKTMDSTAADEFSRNESQLLGLSVDSQNIESGASGSATMSDLNNIMNLDLTPWNLISSFDTTRFTSNFQS